MFREIQNIWRHWNWLCILIIIKLVLQLVSAGKYGFHRDEYLYLDQAMHPGWGYLEVPPMLAWLGALIRLFGDSIYWIKLFPAISGAVCMGLLAHITRDMGGSKWAQITAVTAYLVAPAYLRNHHLFQPVFLNQLMWLLLLYFSIRLVVTGRNRFWYLIGVIAGLGMLTKYSIGFLIVGFFGGLLLSPHRHWLKTRHPYIAMGIALLIFLPNLLWQYHHNFPVAMHMEELRETQLVNVRPMMFILMQFLMLFATSVLWFAGLIGLFSSKRFRTFRFISYGYLIAMALLLVLSGKPYYLLGFYPPLIAAGAIFFERYAGKSSLVRWALPLAIVMLNTPLVPYGIPILPIDRMQAYCAWMNSHAGLDAPLIWEDGVQRSLPQDYADMYGWKEMVGRVSNLFHSLTPSEQASCHIWGGGYGHAGAINYYRDEYDLPEAHSLNGSYLLWIPEENDFDRQILVDDVRNTESTYFGNVTLVDSIRNPYARDPGYIYYRTAPKVDISKAWRELIREHKSRLNR